MTVTDKMDVNALLELARDKSKKSRAALVTAINDLYSGEENYLTDSDRAMMSDILRCLIHEVELSVRRSLAERFVELPNAPPDLVVLLANDEIEVAFPILVKSEVLKDEQLIEIVQYRTMEHQLAIATRPALSEPLSDALVETNNESVIQALISNEGAAISNSTMGYLVEQSHFVSAFQEPMVRRHDLPPELAKKLYWGVSAALRKHLVERFDMDVGELDETIEGAVKDVIAQEAESVRRNNGSGYSSVADDDEDHQELIELLRQGKIGLFLKKFQMLSGLRLALVRRILFEPGGEGLAIACKAIGIDKHVFASILIRIRQGRLGHKEVEMNELSQALEFFDRTEPNSAIALLQRWRRDPSFLNALRLVEQAPAQ